MGGEGGNLSSDVYVENGIGMPSVFNGHTQWMIFLMLAAAMIIIEKPKEKEKK